MRWQLKRKPDVLVLALGANDALRGLRPEETEKNLRSVIELAKENHVKVLLAGMLAPPNLGKDYDARFDRIYPALAKSEHVALIPFLLRDVAGDPALNQEDGIHPNEKGHAIIAKTVFKYLEPLL
jgi:acyl-CoA thioesterase I